jgi:hypothetical protein
MPTPRREPRRPDPLPLCRALAVAALSAHLAPAPLAGQGPASVEVTLDLEIRIHQEFMPDVPEYDGGHWTVSFRQSGPLLLRLNESSGGGILGALGALAAGRRGPALGNVSGSAVENCEDGHGDRYTTDYEEPVRVEPGTLSVTGEGAEVHLWYSIPIVEMRHPGHGHIPARSECHTMDPGMTELWLFTADLEAEGARTNDYGELLISTLSWDELVAASEGRREPLRVDADLRGPGISFEVRGTLGAREPGG